MSPNDQRSHAMCKQKPESNETETREVRGGCCGTGCQKCRCAPILAAVAIALVAIPLLAKMRKP